MKDSHHHGFSKVEQASPLVVKIAFRPWRITYFDRLQNRSGVQLSLCRLVFGNDGFFKPAVTAGKQQAESRAKLKDRIPKECEPWNRQTVGEIIRAATVRERYSPKVFKRRLRKQNL